MSAVLKLQYAENGLQNAHLTLLLHVLFYGGQINEDSLLNIKRTFRARLTSPAAEILLSIVKNLLDLLMALCFVTDSLALCLMYL